MKLRQLLIIAGFFLCACDDVATVVKVCPQTCYTGPVGTQDVGVCHAGQPTCDKDGNILSCDDEVVPSKDLCDGLDNTCTGVVDDDILDVDPFDPANPCPQYGKCFGTWYRCFGGQMQCDWPNGPPEPEICDGQDQDCVEGVDNGLNDQIVFCYTAADQTTALRGACHPGVSQCVNGHQECVGEVTPQPENCSGQDKNCDGIVGDTGPSSNADIIFAIDTSGSMGDIIDSIKSVVCNYADTLSVSDAYRFGLVLIATPDTSYSLAMNLQSAQDMCGALSEVRINGGIEPTASATYAVVNPANPLLLNWRESATHIFVGFGDEVAQAEECGYGDSACMENLVEEISKNCSQSGVLIYWFQEQVDYYFDMAHNCGGQLFSLTQNQHSMLDDLNSIFADICVDSPAP